MTALTTTDAFFVAYQEQRGILMHFGVEVELAGPLERPPLAAALARAVERWPILERSVVARLGGLAWTGPRREILVETDAPAAIAGWRTTPIDAFREAPFGLLWLRRAADRHALAFRCHHAAADGQLFIGIVAAILGDLAEAVGRHAAAEAIDARGNDAPAAATDAPATDTADPSAFAPPRPRPHPLGLRHLLDQTTVRASVREAIALGRRTRTDRSARLALRALRPGPVATCDRRLARVARDALFARATRERVRPPWLVAAAWLHALHGWNRDRGAGEPRLTLEVPVSLRRAPTGTGNHLAVLTLAADARVGLGDLARGLWRDYADGVRRRAHLAVPLLANPARLLPWPVFRRVAVGSTTTGFATSHFTWLVHDPDPRAEVARRSHGALAVVDQQLYTPVCLEMGAALCVLAWPDELQLAITHRTTGLTTTDAADLADHLVSNLT